MNEHSFIASVHRQVKKDPDIDIWKINDTYAGGVPDAAYFSFGPTLWIEYKYTKALPKRDTTLIDLCNENTYLSGNQKIWLQRKHSLGHNVAVILGSPEGIGIFPDLTWQETKPALYYRNGLTAKDVCKYIISKTKKVIRNDNASSSN